MIIINYSYFLEFFCSLTAQQNKSTILENIKEYRMPKTYATEETSIKYVRVFIPPPEDFDPLMASNEQLNYYGFPEKPDMQSSSKHLDYWMRAVTGRLKRIAPNLKQLDVFHGPIRGRKLNGRNSAIMLATSDNWCGVVIQNAPETYSIPPAGIEGRWMVPTTLYTTPPGGGPFECAQWVGIDGDGSTDVLQCGVTNSVYAPGNALPELAYFWIEWYPEPSIYVDLAVQPGDSVKADIALTADGSYNLTLQNSTKAIATTLQLRPPSGTLLKGNCVEWIIERPLDSNGTLSDLQNYGSVSFSGFAFNYPTPGNFTESYPGESATGTIVAVSMTKNGSVISSATIKGSGQDSTVLCSYL